VFRQLSLKKRARKNEIPGRSPLSDVEFLNTPAGTRLAFRHENPDAPGIGILWLGGFKSDMAGNKAGAIAAAAQAAGRRFLRFDYSGHGLSTGDFHDLTLSDWLADVQQIFLTVANGPQLIVASSMGGYLALLLSRSLQANQPEQLARIKGMVLIAPAADMTEALLWAGLEASARGEIEMRGQWLEPSSYGEDYIITRKLIEDGRKHLILDRGIAVDFPVRILHGESDGDVPWMHGLKLYSRLTGDDVTFTLIKGGDHRLSSPRDLQLIIDTIETMLKVTPPGR
jgi:pimeloyl-ACP methyl ester carboxylesterase